MFTCKSCGGPVDMASSACAACGAPVELGRLTGILGIVCRSCDAYNEPRARVCSACGKPLGSATGASSSPAEPAGPGAEEAAPTPPAGLPVPAAAPRAPDITPSAGTPVLRAFGKGGGPATRFVPLVPKASTDAPAGTPIPLVTHCPRCGEAAGAGQFCARCGQPLGQRGTQVMARPPAGGRTATAAFGALAPGRAKLVLERGEGFDGATFRLNAESVQAGRSQGAVLFPADPCLAPHHATFSYRNGALHVRDEGAPGGVFLRLRGLSVPLKPGDLFVIGDQLLRHAGTVPPPAAPPPDGTRRLGAPRPPGTAIVVEEWLEGGVAGRVFVRGGPSVTLGRAGCAINLGDDPFLSQAHAEILVEGEGMARLRDLGSSNGTFIRLPPRAERELRDGDCVRMGREVLRVSVAQ